VADRLALAFAGTFAAALFCTYASDWLDWQPLDIDDAVAGIAIGLLLLLAGPVRRVLHHAAHLPTAAGLSVVALALAPAAWAALVNGSHGDGLDTAAGYDLIGGPGFVGALAVTGLVFVFALRRRLHWAAMALSPVAWVETMVLVGDGHASMLIGVLSGAIVGTGLMIASVSAWVRAVRDGPVWLSRMPASAPIVGARAALTGRVRRALGVALCAPNVATLAAFVLLTGVVAALFGLLGHYDLEYTILYPLIALPGCQTALVIAALAYVLALRHRLYRTGLVASAVIGVHLFLLAWLEDLAIEMETVAFFCATVTVSLLLGAMAVWRASARKAPVRPGELLAFLALASAVALVAGFEPVDRILPAAAIGVWWWFYYRRGAPLVTPAALERIGQRQPLLRLGLTAVLGLTLGVHLLLLHAAVANQTGAMLLAELRLRHLYRISDVAFTRAILADQYLWHDSISVARGGSVEIYPWLLLGVSRHELDQWSETWLVKYGDLDEKRKVTGFGLQMRQGGAGGRLVSYVYGGSPAQRAGVRRGDVIRSIEGIPVDGPDAPALPPSKRSARLELVSATGEVREVTVARAEYERSAVSVERIIDVAGRRVGYLELHNFDKKADNDFIDAAVRLRAQGIEELVLDLRMNPGGRASTSLHIASAIGGERLHGKLFERLVHNERYRDRDRDLTFSTPLRGALSLARIFIIASKDSCSASEGLINGLAPHMEVVTIGGTTCGKPVGSYVIDYGERQYSVIAFRSINARGEGDYYSGLRPRCDAEDDVRRDFGDPEEASLKAALHYIEHGRCPEPLAPTGSL
jgi:hypothetical protein